MIITIISLVTWCCVIVPIKKTFLCIDMMYKLILLKGFLTLPFLFPFFVLLLKYLYLLLSFEEQYRSNKLFFSFIGIYYKIKYIFNIIIGCIKVYLANYIIDDQYVRPSLCCHNTINIEHYLRNIIRPKLYLAQNADMDPIDTMRVKSKTKQGSEMVVEEITTKNK
jgi:hypothetical protein